MGDGSTRWLVTLLAAALALRLGWGLARPADEASLVALPDQREYLESARNLLRGQGLKFHDPRFGDEVYAFRAPGYPLFVAACGGSVRVARGAQALVDTSTVLAVFLLARRWLGAGAALLAASIAAVNPFLIYMSGLLLSETLFTALLAWGMVLVAWGGAFAGGGAGRWLAGVVVLALGVLVRPSALAMPVLLGVGGLMSNRGGAPAYQPSGGGSRRRPAWLPPVSSSLTVTVLVLLPWAYRNYQHPQLRAWIWTTTNGGITQYDGFNPEATGRSDQGVLRPMLPLLRQMDEVQRDRYLAQRAWQYVLDHPSGALRLAGLKVARTWSPVPLSDDYRSAVYQAAGWLFALPLYLLVLCGLLLSPPGGGAERLSWPAKLLLLFPAVYLTVVHALSVGSLRYRLPAEAPMSALAAWGVVVLWRRRRRREL